ELREVLDLSNLVEIKVVDARHYAATAARQPGIERDRHAELRVVGRRGQRVVQRVEVAEPPAVVAGGDADARRQLLLQRDAHFPVVRAPVEAVDERGIERAR